MQDVVNSVIDIVNSGGDSLSKSVEVNFRAVAGRNLQDCADYRGVLEGMGISVSGSNVDLTQEFLLNAFILATAEDGSDVYLSNERAKILAGKKKLNVTLTDNDSTAEWVAGEIGIESYTEEAEGNAWGSYGEEATGELEDDVDEVEEVEEVDVVEVEDGVDRDFTGVKNKIKEFYYQYYKGIVMELSKRYTALFSSGYEVVTPAGILSASGMIGLSGSKLVVKKYDVSISRIYSLFQSQMEFTEIPYRSNVKIADTIYEYYVSNTKGLLYFPNKLLEYAYGRKAPSGDNKESLNTYETHANSSNWGAYCKSEVVDSLMAVVGGSVAKFVYLSAEQGDYYSDEVISKLGEFLKYLEMCLSTCVLMVEYKSKKVGYAEDVSSFKVRVCDPCGTLGNYNMAQSIITTAFAGSTGDVPFSYEPRIEPEVYVKEYAHEFNRNKSQASPLFAYKAYLALQNQGIKPTWNNMILGMFEDGTILKNGSHGVSLESRLTHHIVAGSRAGKGVMTLNILASGLYSNKPLFYLDRKPDMASMLRSICPDMFVVNGGGYGKQYDTYNQFNNLDSMVNWDNVPDYVSDMLDVPKSWDTLGDLFYMRALKLVMSIIVSRGDGQIGNPKLGGDDGILLVVDEFKNFQESYTAIIERILGKVPPSSYLVDMGKMDNEKLKDYEKAKLMRDFSLSYNNTSMYAVSYLNSLVSDLDYLSTKRDAGFNQKEIELSDVFVIGQNLAYGSLDFRLFRSLIDDSTSSGRYKSSGKTGISSNASSIMSKIGIQTASFPFSLVGFKTCDAFFGRNMEDGRETYLAQTVKGSKALGRLDDKASNFAYLNSFTEDTRRKIVGGNTQVNVGIANNCTYFKPFLVLNDAKPGDLYTEGMFQRCAGAGNGPGQEWVSKEDIIQENPNSDGSFVNEAVGFEGYLNMMGATEYRSTLAKSSEIANYVVRDCLGYPGNWFEFITDLRPQWCFTVKDVVEACKGIKPALADVSTNPVISEFVRFNPEEFGLAEGMDTLEDGGYASVSGFMDEESLSDYSNPDFQSTMTDVDMDAIFEDGGYADEKDTQGYSDSVVENEEIDIFDDMITPIQEAKIQETGFGEGIKDTEEGSSAFVDDEVNQLLNRLAELGVNVTPMEQAFESSPEYGMRTGAFAKGGYKDFESSNPTEFSERIEFEDTVDSYANLVSMVTEDVINKFGGLERITSFKVVGGAIVVNGYYYRCKVKDLFAKNIPYDIRREMNAGHIDKLFDYTAILGMPRLRDLEFDSASFVYDYVSTAMGYGSKISVDSFFNDLPALQVLCIGRKLFRRGTYMEQIKNDDTFYHPRMCTKFANCSEEILGKAGNSSWEFTKNSLKSKKYNKVIKVLSVTSGLVATGVTKGGESAIKGTRKVSRGLKGLGKSFKEMWEESKKLN